MMDLVMDLGLVGWGGIAAIIVLLVGAAATQSWFSRDIDEDEDAEGPYSPLPRTTQRQARPTRAEATAFVGDNSKKEARAYVEGGEPPNPWEAHKRSVEAHKHAFAEKRGSAVISIIHHDYDEYVDHDTAVTVIDTLRKAGKDSPVDIILHTPGGISSATQQILHALREHKGRKTAFVPYRAKSAGTMIALACDEIVMGSSAVLGPIDPQYGWMPAQYLSELTASKSADRVDDDMIILSKMAKQAMAEARKFACDYVNEAHKHNGACTFTDELIIGGRNHDYPILPGEAKNEFHLNISMQMPEEPFNICQPPPKADPMLIVSMFKDMGLESTEAERASRVRRPRRPDDMDLFR